MEQSYDGCPWNWQKPPMYCIFMSSHLFSNSSKIWIPISIPTNAQQKPDMSHYFSIRHRNPHISYTLHHKLHHWNKRGQWKTAKWRVESRIWMFALQCHSSYCPWFSAAEIDHSHVEWSYVPYGVLTIAELNMWAGSLCIKGPSINALRAHVYIYKQQLSSFWAPLLAIFNTLFWVYANVLTRKQTKHENVCARHFHDTKMAPNSY